MSTERGAVRRFTLGDLSATLYLGDCREVLKQPIRFDAVVSDPPYGVSNNRGDGKVNGTIDGDKEPPDVAWMAAYPSVIWGANNFTLPRSTGWLVWDKTHAKTCEHSQAELAWTNTVKTIRLHREAYHGFMRQRDGWFHPNQKPPNLIAWAMSWIPERATVLDPYMGSGTTGIACLRTGRNFIGIEKDPRHFATAVDRIEREVAQGVLPLAAS